LGRDATGFSIVDLRTQAVAAKAHRPAIAAEAVNWHRVEDHRQMMLALAEGRVVSPPDATPDQKARTKALSRYWAGDAKGMVETWQGAKYEPLYPTETCLLALACAHLGDDRAHDLTEAVRRFDPPEAQAIESLLLCRQGHFARAADLLEGVLVALRKDPWCMPHVLELIFPAAVQIARQKPDEAARMYRALARPFAVYLYEEQRMAAAHAVASLIGIEAMLEVLQAYEPHVPWNERFLEGRYRAYKAMGHRLATQALDDWEILRKP
jgi:hypothetical protein